MSCFNYLNDKKKIVLYSGMTVIAEKKSASYTNVFGGFSTVLFNMNIEGHNLQFYGNTLSLKTTCITSG